MSLQVEGQMVAAGEGAAAVDALEGLRPRVLAVVPRQLVGAGKLPGAAVPRAPVRLLARVRPDVGLEVRALCVDLFAAGKVAEVRLSAVFRCLLRLVLLGDSGEDGSLKLFERHRRRWLRRLEPGIYM